MWPFRTQEEVLKIILIWNFSKIKGWVRNGAAFFVFEVQTERSTEMFGEGIDKIVTFAFLSTFEKVTRSTIS